MACHYHTAIMKYYLFIFLLLLSFNAKAIGGMLMMTQKSMMPAAMLTGKSVVTMQTEAVANSGTMPLVTAAEMSPSDKKHSHKDKDNHEDSNGCEQCGSCLAHCMRVIISSVSTIDFSSRVTFDSEYLLRALPSTFSRLLRPPQSLFTVV